jgi:CRP-like cAMP-binding protein
MDVLTDGSGSTLTGWLASGATEILGPLGLLFYIGAYLSLQLGLIRGDSWQFPLFNLLAALCLVVSLLFEFNLHAMVLEVSWAVISVIGLVRLYLVHSWFRFSAEERGCLARLAPGLPKDRARKLLARGTWSDAPAGHVLARRGEPVAHLAYVADGVCRIEIDGTTVASIGAGALVGEMTYLTGEPATATVIVDTPARILAFERSGLEKFLRQNEDIRTALEQSVAGDLRRKLASTSHALAKTRAPHAT